MVKIRVKQGVICGGEDETPDGVKYEYFRGIPYAKPPVGPLRFKAPQPLEKFSKPELDCTKERDIACQKHSFDTSKFVGSEDCLFLNIYRPKHRDNGRLLPVLFWIHGGGYFYGSGNSNMFSPDFLIQENVIFVSINYRLGVLGFLSLPKAGIYGNYGIKDQLSALKWVHENISNFGGDPNNVTLFGQSAGATSIGIHLISEKSRKLFHKAILQSGAPLQDWGFTRDPETKARKIAFLLGCQSDRDEEIGEFLRNSSAKDLTFIVQKALSFDDHRRGTPKIPIAMVIEEPSEEAILTQNPSDFYRKKDLLSGIPIIMGNVSNEGLFSLNGGLNKIKELNQDYVRFVPRGLHLEPDSLHCVEAGKEIREFFFGKEVIKREKHVKGMADWLTDFYYYIACAQCMESIAKYQTTCPLYVYYFNYEGELNFFKQNLGLEANLKGVTHTDDVFYCFWSKAFEREVKLDSEETKLRKKLCKLWTNFAKFGDPTPDERELGFKWCPIQKLGPDEELNEFKCLKIDRTFELVSDQFLDRRLFWRRIYKTWNKDFMKVKL